MVEKVTCDFLVHHRRAEAHVADSLHHGPHEGRIRPDHVADSKSGGEDFRQRAEFEGDARRNRAARPNRGRSAAGS